MVGTARVVQAAVLFLKRQAAHLDVHVALNDRNDPDVSKWVLPTSKRGNLARKSTATVRVNDTNQYAPGIGIFYRYMKDKEK